MRPQVRVFNYDFTLLLIVIIVVLRFADVVYLPCRNKIIFPLRYRIEDSVPVLIFGIDGCTIPADTSACSMAVMLCGKSLLS
jgi:hypothetical protein